MPTASANSRAITCLSAKAISWTFSTFPSVTADFEFPGYNASSMPALSRLNPSTLSRIVSGTT